MSKNVHRSPYCPTPLEAVREGVTSIENDGGRVGGEYRKDEPWHADGT